MFIMYLSDIHLEILKPYDITKTINKITANFEQICVLAGDIRNPYSSTYDNLLLQLDD